MKYRYQLTEIGLPPTRTQTLDVMRWFLIDALADGGMDGLIARMQAFEQPDGVARFLLYWEAARKRVGTTLELREIVDLQLDIPTPDGFPILIDDDAAPGTEAKIKEIFDAFDERLSKPFSDAELVRLQIWLLLAGLGGIFRAIHEGYTTSDEVLMALSGEGNALWAYQELVEALLNAIQIFLSLGASEEQQAIDAYLREHIELAIVDLETSHASPSK